MLYSLVSSVHFPNDIYKHSIKQNQLAIYTLLLTLPPTLLSNSCFMCSSLMSLSFSALDHLPALSQLQLMQEFDEAQTHHQLEVTEPSTPSQSTSHLQKMLPPVLISGGLPPVPAKLVKRTQEGSFVEMAELLPETLSSLEYGTNEDPAGQKQKHQEVSNIVNWVQCFGIYIAIISHKEANRIADLIDYPSLIIQASSQCHAGRWDIYDRRFHLKASAVAVTEWSNIDITLWKLAFPDRLPSGGTHCLTKSTAQTRTSFSGSSSGQMRPVCLEWNYQPRVFSTFLPLRP